MESLSTTLQQHLRELGVSLVYLFGSRAEGKAMPHSDVDIGVVFQNLPKPQDSSAPYQKLYELFTDLYPGKLVDIVFLQRAGLELRFDVATHGTLLFEAVHGSHFDFEEQTMIMYADFQPILKQFDHAILNRI